MIVTPEDAGGAGWRKATFMTTDSPNATGHSQMIALRRLLSRLAYPAIYFVVATAVLYLRTHGSVSTGAAFPTVWVTIVLLPTAAFVVVLVASSVIGYFAGSGGKGGSATTQAQAPPAAQPRRWLPSVAGVLLVIAGLSVLVWLARPYIRLLLASSEIGRLERKAGGPPPSGNWIIIPSALVDAPVVDGTTDRDLARAIVHIPGSGTPGSGRNTELEGHNLAELGAARPNELFSLLETVREGAAVYLFWNGKRYVYRVREKARRDVGPGLFGSPEGERLTLVTCVSTWALSISTTRRTVVTALP
jgi:LPXTG-site transpeptidase (sortase) family protein